eukprot:3680951-Rhodomonas_salina.1
MEYYAVLREAVLRVVLRACVLCVALRKGGRVVYCVLYCVRGPCGVLGCGWYCVMYWVVGHRGLCGQNQVSVVWLSSLSPSSPRH